LLVFFVDLLLLSLVCARCFRFENWFRFLVRCALSTTASGSKKKKEGVVYLPAPLEPPILAGFVRHPVAQRHRAWNLRRCLDWLFSVCCFFFFAFFPPSWLLCLTPIITVDFLRSPSPLRPNLPHPHPKLRTCGYSLVRQCALREHTTSSQYTGAGRGARGRASCA
jgi:hypothetical protein